MEMAASLKKYRTFQGSVLDKIIYMTQNMRAAERYGPVKRLVLGYVCTFSTFVYIFE